MNPKKYDYLPVFHAITETFGPATATLTAEEIQAAVQHRHPSVTSIDLDGGWAVCDGGVHRIHLSRLVRLDVVDRENGKKVGVVLFRHDPPEWMP